ncbi:hypothetical protein BTO09_05015 [Gilvibacter sp. SZ-19]|uniref:hypothetical protein n=1 Tax=Gilvibacter sp. SZ-19 TaxID=754429 RepID=UPI000B3C50E2|nr:hypothetical protein [Gilvibacter sp. SZ-19]ARV11743.1 hypothetical protein BTO09_05015 [Gilvibacter sp. SZ-19]
MKTKQIIQHFGLLFLIAFMGSCEQEPLNDSAVDEVNLEAKASPMVRVYKNMLDFPDMETFKSTVALLEEQVEAYDDEFLASWGHLEDEALDEMEDELKYDPAQPLIDFENQFVGFTSLRKLLREKEDEWLANDILDDKNDPDNHYIFDDEVRTVVNEFGNVKIGRLLYHITRYGYITVSTMDVNLLETIAVSNAEEFVDVDGVEIYGGYTGGGSSGNYGGNSGTTGTDGGAECRLGFDRSRYYYPTSNRRIKGKQKLSHPSGLWGSRIKSKTVHYKKKRGKWRRRRGRITAEIRGISVRFDCMEPVELNKTKTRRRRSVKVKIVAPASTGYLYKTKQMQLKTVHKKVSTGSSYDHFFWEN